MSVPLEHQNTAAGQERAERAARGMALRESGKTWREAAAAVDLPESSLRLAYKRVIGAPDHATMLARMRKTVEENFSTILITGTAQLAEKLEREDIKAKDLAVIMGIVGDKMDRWNGWSRGLGGTGDAGGDALYKLISDVADGKTKMQLSVEPVDRSIDVTHTVTPDPDIPSNELVIEPAARTKGD